MGPDGLDVAVSCIAELTDGLEVFIGGPARREDRERKVDLYRCRRHDDCSGVGGGRSSREEILVFGPHQEIEPFPNASLAPESLHPRNVSPTAQSGCAPWTPGSWHWHRCYQA